MALIANFIGYQLAWLAVVWSAGISHSIIGILAALVFIAAQLVASRTRFSDLTLVLAALMCAIGVDGLLAHFGWVHYASNVGALPAPVWILALWAAFAMTLNHSLRWLLGRPVTAALLGAFGGPLAYLAASQGFGAVALELPLSASIGAIAAGWAPALMCLSLLGKRVRQPRVTQVST